MITKALLYKPKTITGSRRRFLTFSTNHRKLSMMVPQLRRTVCQQTYIFCKYSVIPDIVTLGLCRPNEVKKCECGLVRKGFSTTSFWLATKKTNVNLTHYQILGVEKDASLAVIRSAFIKLSKDYHPDINSEDPLNHDKFVQINEAYSILSKSLSRRNYDNNLLVRRHSSSRKMSHHSSTGDSREEPYFHEGAAYSDPQFYENRNKSQDEHYESQPYYGVHNISKVSNKTIVSICVSVILLGAAFHFFVVKKLTDLHIENLNERDKKAHEVWMNANDPNYVSEQVQLLKLKVQEMDYNKRKKKLSLDDSD